MLQLRKHNIFTRVEKGDHHSLGIHVGPHPATVGFLNPLPHCGRPYLPITSLNVNCSKSAEGKV